MPSKAKMKNAAIAATTAALPQIPKEMLDQFVGGGAPMTAEQISAATMALKRALIERALGAELSHHLGDSPGLCPYYLANHSAKNLSQSSCRLADTTRMPLQSGIRAALAGSLAMMGNSPMVRRKPRLELSKSVRDARFAWIKTDF